MASISVFRHQSDRRFTSYSGEYSPIAPNAIGHLDAIFDYFLDRMLRGQRS